MLVQREQLDAAQAIREMCPVWCRSEEALDALADAMQSNADFSAVLIKTIAVDALYATRVRWIDRQRVAMHVRNKLANRDVTKAGPEPVEDLTAVRLADGTTRHYKSFASKYAHFFINSRFPILDRFAVVALREHLGRKELRADPNDGFRASLLRLRGRPAFRHPPHRSLLVAHRPIPQTHRRARQR